MSGLVYITADRIAEVSGGGLVTQQELLSLREFSEEQTVYRRDPILSSISVFSRDNLGNTLPEPWRWDDTLVSRQDFYSLNPRLAHFYSGSFPKTAVRLKERGCKIVWTVAAHDRMVSRREHELMGIEFSKFYPHLCEGKLWKKYISGYALADVIICPSTVAEKTIRGYGPDFENKVIRVIPHGCHFPNEEDLRPFPGNFVVGYMGAISADKGTRYLLEAWRKLDYKDGSLLVLAGRDSASPAVRQMIAKYGGGNIHLMGWVKSVADFYNSISLYIQPSATEGYGMEALEAMSYGRPVICSKGAGASDLLPDAYFESCSSEAIIKKIQTVKTHWNEGWGKSGPLGCGGLNRTIAKNYTWDKIRKQYRNIWLEVLE